MTPPTCSYLDMNAILLYPKDERALNISPINDDSDHVMQVTLFSLQTTCTEESRRSDSTRLQPQKKAIINITDEPLISTLQSQKKALN